MANSGGVSFGYSPSNNRVGTSGHEADNAGERNVISGNIAMGIHMGDAGTTGNVVAGNYIGVDATGMSALGNGLSGIVIRNGASGNRIGTDGDGVGDAAEANVISANGIGPADPNNGDDGIRIKDSGTSANVIAGNYIGTDASGTAALGNTGNGVGIVNGASNNTIGDTVAGAGNVIAFNSGAGVAITGASSVNNAIRANAIHDNAALGIDLGGDGVTPNTPGGPHTGPNNLQNFPILNSANSVPSTPPVPNALVFDGSDDFVAVPSAPTLDIAGAITLEAWINPQTVAVPFADIISKRVSPTQGDAANYAFRQVYNRLEFYFTANGAYQEYFSDPVLVANQWQHVAATFDPSTQQIEFYVDGVLVSTRMTPYTLTTYPDTPLTLGAVSTNGTESFPGQLAEVRIWTGARSQIQILADRGRTTSNTDPALVGYWHFDEGAGTTAFDHSGNHNDGSLGGGSSAHQPVYGAVVPSSGGGSTVITGTLNSTPNTIFQLDFFANAAADPTGFGQGQSFVGAATVKTDANTGAISFTVVLPKLPAGETVVSATATDPAGNTSEFSADIITSTTTATAVNSSLSPSPFGQTVTFTATVTPGSGTFDNGGTVQFAVDGSNFGAGEPEQRPGRHQRLRLELRYPHGHGRIQRRQQLPSEQRHPGRRPDRHPGQHQHHGQLRAEPLPRGPAGNLHRLRDAGLGQLR